MTLTTEPTSAPTAPSPGVRTAWRVAASLAAVALLAYGLTVFLPLLAHEEREFTRTFPTEGIEVVDIDLSSGSAEVVGADVDEIRVLVHVSEGLRATGHSQAAVGNRLVLAGTCPVFLSMFCDVDYRVEVPRDVAVEANVDNGRLTVRGIEGPVVAENDNGSIELADVTGDLTLESDNGSLRGQGLLASQVEASTDNGSVDLAFARPPDSVIADSDNGSVTLYLPEVAGGYRVDMDTDNGSTDLSVASDPASSRVIVATSDNGDVAVLDAGSAS